MSHPKRSWRASVLLTKRFEGKSRKTGAKRQVMHYSPYNGKVLPGHRFTDTGFRDTFRCLYLFPKPDVLVNEPEHAGGSGERLHQKIARI